MVRIPSRSFVCDSSSLISLADSCLIDTLFLLNEKLGAQFLVPYSVEEECITRPLHNKTHALAALRIQNAVDVGAVSVVEQDVGQEAEELMWLANNSFYFGSKPLHIIHRGEAEVLALAARKQAANILIDERTTRMLLEAPADLAKHLRKEFGPELRSNERYLRDLGQRLAGVQFFRSSELVILAYEHGLFDYFGGRRKKALEASLYNLKYTGCSVRFNEVSEFISSLR